MTQDFLSAINEVKACGRGEYLSVVAMMIFLAGNQKTACPHLRQELQHSTRGELKRAIKCMRQIQSEFQYPEHIDGAVSLIRKEYLQK